ncbi:1-phosphofructokinase family hexose kinase [Rubrivivax sp. JA1026]|uniref:1-phosphofructokinase family hexose kinase n=1 Tax=Rubrivivax sp. JA1026 TaxID=2710888 RepID=UPI0013E96F94|nr:1-phosphofructokinase family hexose kinase [Rubrivivax sp. JA1026]
MTIRCVSFNPAIDQTVTLERLVPGEVVRALAVRHDAGGKGVNVASCLADAGQAVELHGLLGRDNAAIFEQLFAAKGIADWLQRVTGATRTNVKLLETGGRTTDVNLPGFTAGAADAEAVFAGLAEVGTGELVVISGSQPGGLAADTSARLAAALAGRGARVVADLSGAALDAVLALPPGALPYAVKPNRAELEAWAGRRFDERTALIDAARALVARGIALVVVSLGTEGAAFVTAEGALQAAPPRLATGSTVGAGDAMVAGITSALADGLALDALARRATAFAAGKLGREGAHLPPAAELDALAAAVRPQPLDVWAAAPGSRT